MVATADLRPKLPSPTSRSSAPVAVPMQACLAGALEQLGTHRDDFARPLEALTPAAFVATLG